MQRLATKVAIVTGAASGIGLGIAQLFIKEDTNVVFSDINRFGKVALTLRVRMLYSSSVIFPIQSQSRIWLQKQFRPLAQLIF